MVLIYLHLIRRSAIHPSLVLFIHPLSSGLSFAPETAVIPEEDRLYFVHYLEKKVEVANLDGTVRRVLIEHQTGCCLRDIVVDPVAR